MSRYNTAVDKAHSCAICNQVVVNLDDRSQRHILGQLGNLKRRPGADRCELLQQYISVTTASSETNVELDFVRYRGRINDLRAAIMREGWDDSNIENDRDVQEFHVYTPEGDPATKALPIQPPGLDVGSERAFKVARTWLKTCGRHSGCSISSRTTLPTRVIDVSGHTPRLVETREEGLKHGKYLALSYCWGGPQPIETTMATLQQYSKALPVNDLPQTIKDAITVTHALGIKYLWVDAICIVQDNLEDKAAEINQMTEIYNSSYVTISASTATTCRDGFLHPRELDQKPIKLRAKFSRSKEGSVLLMVDRYKEEPIHKRGWTMQEHLLAPRLLTFGALCMEYRCMSGTERDGGTPLPHGARITGIPMLESTVASVLYSAKYGGPPQTQRRNFKLITFLHRTGLLRLALKFTGEKKEEWHAAMVEQWSSIVEAYTARSLGFLDDRLNAISGIARKIHRKELGVYLAGLFSFELLPQLVWARADFQHPLPRPRSYRSPSWSWSAIDGAVNFRSGSWGFQETAAELLESRIVPVSDVVRYTTYTSGMIRVSGNATSMRLQVDKDTQETRVPEGHKGISIIMDAIEPQETFSREVILLQVIYDHEFIRGLVIQEKSDGTFRRLGYCELPQHGNQTAHLREVWAKCEFCIV